MSKPGKAREVAAAKAAEEREAVAVQPAERQGAAAAPPAERRGAAVSHAPQAGEAPASGSASAATTAPASGSAPATALAATTAPATAPASATRSALVRGWAAYVALLCSTSLMNASVFPQFDAVFMFARDISVTFGALAFLLIGALAWRAPRWLRPRHFMAAALGCLVVGGALLAGGLALGAPVPLVAGSSLVACGRAGATASVGLVLATLSPRGAAVAIAAAFSVQMLVAPLFSLAPLAAPIGVAAYLLLPLAALGLAAPLTLKFLAQAATQQPPVDLAVTRPTSFLAPFSALFVCLFLFQVAFGFALRFDEIAGTPRASELSALPVVLVLVYVLAARRPFSADLLVSLSALAVIGGFLLATRSEPSLLWGDVTLLNAGNGLFAMTAQLALVSIAARNPLGAATVIAWGNGASSAGSLVGAAAGMIANGWVVADASLRFFIPAVLLLVFAAYVLIGLRNFTFKGAIEGVEPVGEQPAALAPDEVFQERCQAVAREFSLTPREAEVFAMLARGRDRAYIEEALVVSRNTVKAHVKHVYAKLGIHSHQELIDLVESEIVG